MERSNQGGSGEESGSVGKWCTAPEFTDPALTNHRVSFNVGAWEEESGELGAASSHPLWVPWRVANQPEPVPR
jgi:hypothetical protein